MSNMTQRRLTRELKQIQKDPPKGITAVPNGDNILEWHYLIEGAPGTPYFGGLYWGKLMFPSEYPLKPPSVSMLTPNGRFRTNRALCLSMTNFHPETWNPLWSVSTILTGVFSFMNENTPTLGSIETSVLERKKYAKESLRWNCSKKLFRELFPDVYERFEEERKARGETGPLVISTPSSTFAFIELERHWLVAAAIAVLSIAFWTLL